MSSVKKICIFSLDRWYLRSLEWEMVWQYNKAHYKCLPWKERKRDRHFPLLPTVKVPELSPKQPHACGNHHALSFFVLIWKCNSVFLTNTASLLAWQIFVTQTQLMYKWVVTCWLKWFWINCIEESKILLKVLFFHSPLFLSWPHSALTFALSLDSAFFLVLL